VYLARALLKSGNPKGAMAAADIAIGTDDSDWEAFRVKSEAYAALGQAHKAAEYAAEAKLRAPEGDASDASQRSAET
jgi:predicted Zn-dependent protease